MFKVKYKDKLYNREEIYTVYNVKTNKVEAFTDLNKFVPVEFLIYSYGKWKFVDAKECLPVE